MTSDNEIFKEIYTHGKKFANFNLTNLIVSWWTNGKAMPLGFHEVAACLPTAIYKGFASGRDLIELECSAFKAFL